MITDQTNNLSNATLNKLDLMMIKFHFINT